MEDKLKSKHLAPYSPYKLNGIWNGYKSTLVGLIYRGDILKEHLWIELEDDTWHDISAKYYKPIFRPLSDLTKEIEINGEKFVPINTIAEMMFLDEPDYWGSTMAIKEFLEKILTS